MPEDQKSRSLMSKIWGFFRWPFLVGYLIVALVIFFVGLVCNFGYTGTTSLRAINLNDEGPYVDANYWRAFYPILFTAQKGKPYIDKDGKINKKLGEANKDKKNVLDFDKRLVRELIYLAKGSDKNDQKCGWNGLNNSQHDRIVLQIEGEALSNPSTNLPSSSTLTRGVGVRITEADNIRCSYKRKLDPDKDPRCNGKWYVYNEHNILFSDSSKHFRSAGQSRTTICPEEPKLIVECAVDYFPHEAVDAPDGQKLPEVQPFIKDNPIIAGLNPKIFEMSEIVDKSREAAVYKIAQLGLQLLATDEAGCENKTASIWPSKVCEENARKGKGNEGNCRNIPYTIIFPLWASQKMGSTKTTSGKDKDASSDDSVWSAFKSIARGEYYVNGLTYKGFPSNLQDESPLAGISPDEKLDSQGLHFNY